MIIKFAIIAPQAIMLVIQYRYFKKKKSDIKTITILAVAYLISSTVDYLYLLSSGYIKP